MKKMLYGGLAALAIVTLLTCAYASGIRTWTGTSTTYTPDDPDILGLVNDEFERERLALDTAFTSLESGSGLHAHSISSSLLKDYNVTQTDMTSGAKLKTWETSFNTTANTTANSGIARVQGTVTIQSAYATFVAVPASSGGTVLGYLWKRKADGTFLKLGSAASVNLEGLSNHTPTAIDLNTSYSVLGAGDFIYATCVSNNADMTGGTGGNLTISYYGTN